MCARELFLRSSTGPAGEHATFLLKTTLPSSSETVSLSFESAFIWRKQQREVSPLLLLLFIPLFSPHTPGFWKEWLCNMSAIKHRDGQDTRVITPATVGKKAFTGTTKKA